MLAVYVREIGRARWKESETLQMDARPRTGPIDEPGQNKSEMTCCYFVP